MDAQITPEQFADMNRKKTPAEDRKAMLARQIANLLQINASGNQNQQQLGINANLPLYDKGPNSISADLNASGVLANNNIYGPQGTARITYRRQF